MHTFAKFLSAGACALLVSAGSSFALDTDPGYGPGISGTSAKGANGRVNRYAPQYFRPTQRYYGKGYTVAYRFIPWSDRMRGMNGMTAWDSEQFRLPTNAAATTIANGVTPRITYFYRRPSASTGILPDHNSEMATTPKPVPPIGEAPAPAKP